MPPRAVTLLERSILCSPVLVKDKSAEQSGAGADRGPKPSVPADSTRDRSDTRAADCTREGTLLSGIEIGASCRRKGHDSEQQQFPHLEPLLVI
jgi:hypothetical protein